MDKNLAESFYIKDIELFTVLASFGVKKMYGINTDIDIKTISETSQNGIISSLYQKNYLSFEDDDLVLTKDFSEIVQTLIKADSFLYIRRWQNDIPALLFYLANNSAVCIERSINDDDTLKVNRCGSDWIKDFIKNECIGEDISTIDITTECGEFSYIDELSEKIIKEKNYTAVIEKFSTDTGKMINRLVVKDLDVRYQLILQNEYETIILKNDNENQEYVAKLFCD